MNPEIDLKSISGTVPGDRRSSGADRGSALVAPPRRILTRYVLPMLLLAGFAGVGVLAFRDTLQRPVEVQVVLPVPLAEPVATVGGGNASVKSAPIQSKRTLFQAPGWIEPEPYPIMLSSLRMGTVESIDVLEGEAVTSGAVIARLVDEDARLAVDSARSALELKKAKYQAAMDTWKNPTDLVESIETAKATGDKLQAEARRLEEMLELAKVEADVGSALTRGGYEASLDTFRKQTQLSASRNQLAETHAAIKLNSATLSAASERLALRIEDREAVESARAELAAAEAALAEAQLSLSRSVISAPTSGTIMRLYVSPGAMLSTEMEDGMVIASLYKPEHLQVRVDVPLAEAAKVRPGLAAEIKVEALPDKKFSGELINIVPEFDIQKNTLPVKVRIHDPANALRPEMIARVDFVELPVAAARVEDRATSAPAAESAMQSTQFMVPAETVKSAGGGHFVWLAGPEGHAIRREVSIAEGGKPGYAIVTEGLRISDKVIAAPADGITENSKVTISGLKHDTD